MLLAVIISFLLLFEDLYRVNEADFWGWVRAKDEYLYDGN